MSKESNIQTEVGRRYQPLDNLPLPRVGKTARDKLSGAWGNRLANLVMRGEESRGGGLRKGGKKR